MPKQTTNNQGCALLGADILAQDHYCLKVWAVMGFVLQANQMLDLPVSWNLGVKISLLVDVWGWRVEVGEFVA